MLSMISSTNSTIIKTNITKIFQHVNDWIVIDLINKDLINAIFTNNFQPGFKVSVSQHMYIVIIQMRTKALLYKNNNKQKHDANHQHFEAQFDCVRHVIKIIPGQNIQGNSKIQSFTLQQGDKQS